MARYFNQTNGFYDPIYRMLRDKLNDTGVAGFFGTTTSAGPGAGGGSGDTGGGGSGGDGGGSGAGGGGILDPNTYYNEYDVHVVYNSDDAVTEVHEADGRLKTYFNYDSYGDIIHYLIEIDGQIEFKVFIVYTEYDGRYATHDVEDKGLVTDLVLEDYFVDPAPEPTISGPIIATPNGNNIAHVEVSGINSFERKMVEFGFMASLTSNPGTDTNVLTYPVSELVGEVGGPFPDQINVANGDVTDLLPGRTYYICAYMVTSKGTIYSQTTPFTTPLPIPTIENVSSSDIHTDKFTLTISDINPYGQPITECIIYYSTSQDIMNAYDRMDVPVVGALGITYKISQTQILDGLEDSTTYYWRVSVKTPGGEKYLESSTRTLVSSYPPTIGGGSINSITANSITISLSNINSYGLPIEEIGVYFSKNTNVMSDTDKIYIRATDLDGQVLDGSAMFSHTYVGLFSDTTYYYIVQIRTGAGSGYFVGTPFSTSHGVIPHSNNVALMSVTQTAMTLDIGGMNTYTLPLLDLYVLVSTYVDPASDNNAIKFRTTSTIGQVCGGVGNMIAWTPTIPGLSRSTLYYVSCVMVTAAGKFSTPVMAISTLN